jgi:type I restriction enzyme R subunit
VVWHTQGSGKSFSMLFYAARIVRHPAMQNPTLVVLTDCNDLDDQLFGQFQRCAGLLGQTPVQAANREHLRELLNRASGGVLFTTIQKFMPEKGEAMPELSARQNIVVIADEAHRSQYGFGGKLNEKTGDMSYGFASNLRDALPNASFIGFTGTPIEQVDANTRAVFGDYISIYDIQQAWPIRPLCRSTTKAALPNFLSMPPSCPSLMKSLRRSPKARSKPLRKS